MNTITPRLPVTRFEGPVFKGLREDFADVRTVTTDFEATSLSNEATLETTYSSIGVQMDASSPTLYVGGFNEGREAVRNFAIDFASLGNQIIVIDQNTERLPKLGVDGKHQETTKQALNHLAAIQAEGLHMEPGLRIIAHSYGALIFQRMVELADELGWECFEEANVALVAPAGIVEDESILKLSSRFAKVITGEGALNKLYDPDKRMYKAGVSFAKAKKLRTIREAFELASLRYDASDIAMRGISQTIVSFARDPLYRQPDIAKIYESFYREHAGTDLELGKFALRWLSPNDCDYLEEYQEYLQEIIDSNSPRRYRRRARMIASVIANSDAGHNDVLFHTRRVSRSVDEALKTA